MADITYNQPKVIADKQIFKEPEIHITGDSMNGSRQMTVVYPVENENGDRIDTISKTYTGQEFNEAYEAYHSDKGLSEKVLADLEVEADTSDLADDFINPEEANQE